MFALLSDLAVRWGAMNTGAKVFTYVMLGLGGLLLVVLALTLGSIAVCGNDDESIGKE